MVSGVLGATSEAVVLRSMRACLIVAIVVAAITGCSRAKLLPVTPNADPRDYFPEAVQQRLAIAVERGDAEGIAAAVKAGADVDKPGGEGIRPIMWALVKGNVEGFRHLLEHDADCSRDSSIRPACRTDSRWRNRPHATPTRHFSG
jgi:hypothetical protein